MSRPEAAVVGGGLAGIGAALHLSQAGVAVTLIEARPRLGGAATSFLRHGMPVDTGQHVFLRCYSAYRQLLAALGASEGAVVQPRFSVPVLSADGRRHVLRRGRLPAPAHLLPILTGYPVLSRRDRLRLLPAMLSLRRLDPDSSDNDARCFGDWLRQTRQSDRAVAGLWRLVALAALNGEPDEVSLALAVRVFRTGLVDTADAADLGIPVVPLADLHAHPAARALAERGATVLTDAPVRAVERTPAGYSLRCDGATVAADAVVVAVPPPAALRILPADLADAQAWPRLGNTPIVNVHVVYDRQVTELPFAAAIGSPVQWVFDKTRMAGLRRGQYLAVSLSGAYGEVDRPAAELRTQYLAALARLFPAAADARVDDAFVTRERAATFRQAPGSRTLRPAAQTREAGLLLAGAWVDTGWPDTMEGAVRSGLHAARLAEEYLTRSTRRARVVA